MMCDGATMPSPRGPSPPPTPHLTTNPLWAAQLLPKPATNLHTAQQSHDQLARPSHMHMRASLTNGSVSPPDAFSVAATRAAKSVRSNKVCILWSTEATCTRLW